MAAPQVALTVSFEEGSKAPTIVLSATDAATKQEKKPLMSSV